MNKVKSQVQQVILIPKYICFVSVITILILLLVGRVHALSFININAESSQSLTGALVFDDTTASSGQAIRFGTFSSSSVKVMPLGDSITNGYGSWSYRYWLTQKLKQAGITNVDMVGTQTSVNQTPDPIWDQNHEGHNGIRSSDVSERIVGWASASRPDIVLMHLGTNSLQNNTTAGSLNELSGVIDNLRTVVPNVTIVLAKIIPRTIPGGADHVAYNAGIATLASQKNTAQSLIVVVDQYTGFDIQTDLFDGLHPNESGNQKMADKWYAALVPLLLQSQK